MENNEKTVQSQPPQEFRTRASDSKRSLKFTLIAVASMFCRPETVSKIATKLDPYRTLNAPPSPYQRRWMHTEWFSTSDPRIRRHHLLRGRGRGKRKDNQHGTNRID